MVYDMVKLAGGDLRLANTPTGASVALRLPYRPAPTMTGGLALLVEDNDTLRTQVREMLVALDHSVIEATSVDEAVALAADLPDIVLVLSDIRLEGAATGLELVERMRASQVPIILMTSLPPGDPLHQAAARVVPVLRKPFNLGDLSALLRPEAAQ
jgi:CheY-like chemotaxis protein